MSDISYYTIYNTTSGEILSIVAAQTEQDLNNNIPSADYSYTSGKYYASEGWFDNGNFTTYSAQQKQLKTNFPSYSAIWSNQTMSWTDQRTLADQKQAKKDQITVLREQKNYEPITYDNALFDCDELSQRNIQAWVTTINAGTSPPQGFVWRDYNNVDHAADGNFIVGLNNTVVARGTQLYQTSWTKKAEIDALTTAEQVSAYDITTGW